MKPLKLLFLICLLGCFSISISKAQGSMNCYTKPFNSDYVIPCTGEEVNGDLTMCFFTNGKNFGQLRVDGEVECIATKNVYAVHEVINNVWNVYDEKFPPCNSSFPFTMTFHKDGKLVFLIHGNYHATINANGDMVVEFEYVSGKCK